MLGSLVVRLGRVLGFVVVWWLMAGGGAASATTGHAFVGQFGGLGGDDGQFSDRVEGGSLGAGPVGVGVLGASGEVFTVDKGIREAAATPRVQRFAADGTFLSKFLIDPLYNVIGPLAVDPTSSGAVYVSMNRDPGIGAVAKYGADGVFAHELDASGSGTTIKSPLFGPTAVAVDPVDGTVYVTATNDLTGAPVVDRFNGTTGAFIDFIDGSSSPEGGFSCTPTSLAVDGSQRVYVLDPCKNGTGRVDQFSAAGAFGATVDDGSRGAPSAVAADPVSDEVYVSEAGLLGVQITHFSAGGAGVVYTFDATNVGGVRGMAVGSAGTVYTSDATTAFVERFARFDGPTVVTGGTQAPEARSVALEGTINPEGISSSYHFEYGTDLTYGKRSPVVVDTDAGDGNAVVAASAMVDGLEPNKTYYYRLVGSNDSGSIVGAGGTFVTAPAPSTIDGTPPAAAPAFASAITPRSARLHGTVNFNNAPAFSFASYSVEYGSTTAYGSTVVGTGPDFGYPCGFLTACGGQDKAVFVDVEGLEPGQTYHFRVVSNNGQGPAYGADQTFVTAPGGGGTATGVTAGRATLTGTINPHSVATSYHFDYGPTSSYGASTPEIEASSGDDDLVVAQAVTGLLPDTTYHVRVVATSVDGVVRFGADGAFRTAAAPTAEVFGATAVSTDAATVAGHASTFGLAGSYHFDVWSLDSTYSYRTEERLLAGNASVERVTAMVAGLPAGERFAVQLTVSSNDAIGVSDLGTFGTAAAPRIFPPAPGSDGVSSYGCAAPRLDRFGAHPKPGEMIGVSGQDLGVGGNVMLGDELLKPAEWSATGFKVEVPQDAAGTLPLTVNCGRRSNTIAVALFQEPDRSFAVTGRSVVGTTATLKVRVAGPGKLESFGAGSRASKVTVKKAGTVTLKVKLSSAGAKALGRSSRARKVKAHVRFTPAGGRPASKTVTITFKRKGAR